MLQKNCKRYYWSEYRRQIANEFDRSLDEKRDLWVNEFGNQEDSDTLSDLADQVQNLQIQWTELYTHLVDEVDHLQFVFNQDEEYDGEEGLWPEPIEIPPK
ncbi:MAG: hypothetical protein ABEI86_13665, partial [Halobacteriaceae archaeon]